MDGMGWVDWWDWWSGYQKCPPNFFILRICRSCICIFIYINSKVITNILVGFKFRCQVGGWRYAFQNYIFRLYKNKYLKKGVANIRTTKAFFFLFWNQVGKLEYDCQKSSPYTLPSGSSASYTRCSERQVYVFMDGCMRLGIKQFFNFLILCGLIDHVYRLFHAKHPPSPADFGGC